MSDRAEKPILFVDVDGVISLFGFSPAAGKAPGVFHWVDGVAHCIPAGAGAWLVRLAQTYELVWATGWETTANEHLLPLLDLPFQELPCLTFGGRAVFGSAHWKLDAITEYSGDRPLAWIDDNHDDACRLWALERRAPTLLVETRSSVGMTDDHVRRLEEWAAQLAHGAGGRTAAA
jgi:hypothetical protein